MARKDYSQHPFVSNYPELKEWLDKLEAQCLWQLASHPDWEYPQWYVEAWTANGKPFVIQVFSNRMGWEIFTPLGSILKDETFADAERRLGLVE